MAYENANFLTTGQAAARLGVKPDTVLKWVRAGKLRAWKTGGGHNRIAASDLRLLGPSSGDTTPRPQRSLFCWEYFAESGRSRSNCTDCIVHLARAVRCFEAQRWLTERGPGRTCPGSCDSCSYYRRAHGLAERVLIVGADDALQRDLESHMSESRCSGELTLRFASGVYEASAAVGAFLPGVVVVDQDLPADECKVLIRALESDRRIPWVRTVVAANGPEALEQLRHCQPLSEWLMKPFGIEELAAVVRSLQVELAGSEEEG